MHGVTYDMQKLDEAVSALAVGTGSIQERLRCAMLPLLVLQTGGLANEKMSAELKSLGKG